MWKKTLFFFHELLRVNFKKKLYWWGPSNRCIFSRIATFFFGNLGWNSKAGLRLENSLFLKKCQLFRPNVFQNSRNSCFAILPNGPWNAQKSPRGAPGNPRGKFFGFLVRNSLKRAQNTVLEPFSGIPGERPTKLTKSWFFRESEQDLSLFMLFNHFRLFSSLNHDLGWIPAKTEKNDKTDKLLSFLSSENR